MKPGVRALGLAESYRSDRSTVCGVVTTTEGVVDGVTFADCTVGGLDATDALLSCWEDLGREDVQYVFVSGVALAWYNLIDAPRLAEGLDVPALLITYEASDGLSAPLAEVFTGDALTVRKQRYDRLPSRISVELPDGEVFVRVLGDDVADPAAVVRSFTRAGQRPEPVRVARLAARGADRWCTDESESL